MRPSVRIGLLISLVLWNSMQSDGSSFPSSAFTRLASALERDFISIDRLQTVSMSDDPGGRFDIVAIGAGRSHFQGWRVEIWSVDHSRLRKRWDSDIAVKEEEFVASGSNSIRLHIKEYDYNLLIEGCALHECFDGISGFLVYYGSSGKMFKARVVTRGLDKPITGPAKYDVTFPADITDDARKILQEAICGSTSISNKRGLPFECAGS